MGRIFDQDEEPEPPKGALPLVSETPWPTLNDQTWALVGAIGVLMVLMFIEVLLFSGVYG